MFLPDDLYHEGLNPRDLSGWPFHFYAERAFTSQAATAVYSPLPLVPSDKALTVMSIAVSFLPGGLLTTGVGRIYISDGVVQHTLKETYFPAGTTNTSMEIIEELIIPPNWKVAAVGFFSAATSANAVNLYATGWLIPAGGLR